MIPKKHTIIVLLLLLGTWYITQHVNSVSPTPIKQSLASFPTEIGQWKKIGSSESSEDVVEMLGVDDDLQYTYQSPGGKRISLYIGYYSAVGVTGGYHSPRNCIPGGGWGIDDISPITLNAGIEGNDDSVVSQMMIRNGNQYQIVLYWFQNRGRIIASEYWEKIYLVLDALRMGRRDGTFVRIMAPVQGTDFVSASNDASEFSQQVIKHLESYLPGKSL